MSKKRSEAPPLTTSTEDDPVQVLVRNVRVGGVLFSISFDLIAVFRAFENSARQLPNHADRTPREELSRSPATLPPAGAIAREAAMHFQTNAGPAMKAALDWLLASSYGAGIGGMFLHAPKPASSGVVLLPNNPVAEASKVLADPELTELRSRLIDTVAENARQLYPKRPGRSRKNDYEAMRREVDAEMAKGKTKNAAAALVAGIHNVETDTILEYVRDPPAERSAKPRARGSRPSRRN